MTISKGLECWRGTEYLTVGDNKNHGMPTTQDKLSFVARMVLGGGLALAVRRFNHCAFRAESLLIGTIAAEALDTTVHRIFPNSHQEQYENEVVHLLGLKGVFRGIQTVCILTLLAKSVVRPGGLLGVFRGLTYAGLAVGGTALIAWKTYIDHDDRK